MAELPEPAAIRERVQQQLARFHPGIKRFINPHRDPAGLEENLYERKMDLILKMRDTQ